MDNFEFLQPIDKSLYGIISEAEKLYRDEYFEQCITQTRKFGENVCKNVLGSYRTTENTFDDMLATLKDKVTNVIQEKDFVNDLYFLKREGNIAVHSSNSKNDGIIALECLQRAFEIALSYAVYYKKHNSNLLRLRYDCELLATGKKAKKSLVEKYNEQKNENKIVKTKKKAKKDSNKKIVSKTSKKNLFFKMFLVVSAFISAVLVLTIFVISLI